MADRPDLTRRRFGALVGGTLASLALGSTCTHSASQGLGDDSGRLTARPKRGVKTTASGHRRLGLGGARDAALHIPPNAGDGPLPLLLLFHGAGGSGENQLARFGTIPDELKVAVLAADSRGPTWDGIRGGYGPDIDFLDRALKAVFDTVNVDPARLTIGGFSDGASYALSLGLINGDLFPKVCAFSPGFIVPGTPHGKPKFFFSHGLQDDILPIDRCSRRLVPELQRAGYEVTYKEFAGGHQVTPAITREGFAWIAK